MPSVLIIFVANVTDYFENYFEQLSRPNKSPTSTI